MITAWRCYVIRVPFTDGRPDMQLPAAVQHRREGRVHHFEWGDGRSMHLLHLGAISGDQVLCGPVPPAVVAALTHLGARVERLPIAWLTPARRTWLLGAGVAEVGGFPVPPLVISGEAAIGDTEA